MTFHIVSDSLAMNEFSIFGDNVLRVFNIDFHAMIHLIKEILPFIELCSKAYWYAFIAKNYVFFWQRSRKIAFIVQKTNKQEKRRKIKEFKRKSIRPFIILYEILDIAIEGEYNIEFY